MKLIYLILISLMLSGCIAHPYKYNPYRYNEYWHNYGYNGYYPYRGQVGYGERCTPPVIYKPYRYR